MNALNILAISYDSRVNLNIGINKVEISRAIDGMNSGKQAGPDGIPIDLYKKCKDKLLIPLLDMFTEAFEKRRTSTFHESCPNYFAAKA